MNMASTDANRPSTKRRLPKRTGLPCSICTHPLIGEIDAACRRSALRRVARKYDLSAWSLQRHAKHAAERARERGEQPAKKPLRPRLALPPMPSFSGDTPDIIEVQREVLRVLKEARRTADPEDRPKIAMVTISASKLLARLEGQIEISEIQIIRSKAFGCVMRAIEGVLKNYPPAAKEVAAALKKEVEQL